LWREEQGMPAEVSLIIVIFGNLDFARPGSGEKLTSARPGT